MNLEKASEAVKQGVEKRLLENEKSREHDLMEVKSRGSESETGGITRN